MALSIAQLEPLVSLPGARAVLHTDGLGAPRLVGLAGLVGEGAPLALARAADLAVGALSQLGGAVTESPLQFAVVVHADALVALAALPTGEALVAVATPEANLGRLINACKKVLASLEDARSGDAGA